MKLFRPRRHGVPAQGPDALVRAGDQCNRAGDWPEAARHYRAALEQDPTRAGVWVQLGHACKEHGDFAQAEAAYRRAVAIVPGDSDPLIHLGHLLSLRGEPAASIDILTRVQGLLGDPTFAADTIAAQRAALTAPLKPATRPAWADRDIEALWVGAGFSLAALAMFDPWIYRQINPDVRISSGDGTPLALVRHFCETGIERALPFSLVERFDPEFYRGFYLNGMPCSPANAYRHWLDVGAPRHMCPNERRWLQSLLGDAVTTLDGVDPALSCAFADAGVLSHTRRTIVEGFIDDCARDENRPVGIDEGNAAIFHAIASRAESAPRRSARRDARRLRERIHLHAPLHRDNARALARGLIDLGADLPALAILRPLVTAGGEPPASYHAQAEAETRLGLPDTALSTLLAGCMHHPGDASLAAATRTLEETCFHQTWAQARAMARIGRIADGQHHIAAFLDRLTSRPPPQAAMPADRTSVAIIGKMNLAQCRLYRIDQRAEQLRASGATVEIFDVDQDLDAYLVKAPAFGTVIFYRVPATPPALRAIRQAHAVGATTYYEIDDPLFDVAHFPEPFSTYGGAIDQETHDGLALGAPLFARALTLCGQAIASTAPLAELMRPLVEGDVRVVPNVMGNAHRIAMAAHEARPATPDGPVTIFYGSNTKANRRDIADILEPALATIVSRHGARVRLCIVGALAEDSLLPGLGANVVLLPVIEDVQHYWALLAQADINLAVLAPSVATNAKSGIKWMEAAMFGIPSVLSDVPPYRDVARPDATALFATSTADWVRALDRLIGDPGLRERIGEAARREALAMSAPSATASHADAIMGRGASGTAPVVRHPRILVVNVFYPPQAIGGATRIVHDTIRDLQAGAGDFHIEVFTTMEGARAHDTTVGVRDGVVVTSVGALEVDDKDAIAEDPEIVAIFAGVLDRFRPDAVHFHCIQRLTVGVVEAVRKRAIPYAITTHDAWWISDHQFAIDATGAERLYDYHHPIDTLTQGGRGAFERMERLRPALFGAEAVVAVSEPFAGIHRRCGVPRVMVIENGVPPLHPVNRTPTPGARIRLGFLGGLSRHKGWDLIRIALSSGGFGGLELLAIDHAMPPGSERHDRFGDTPVLFRGKTAQGSVATLYAQVDVLLAPSIWPESFGLVTREAAACGCWVIASRLGAIGDAIEDGVNGHHVDVSTPDGLRDILTRIQAEPARYRSPPGDPPRQMRTSVMQARDTAALYHSLLSTPRRVPT